MNKLIKFIAGAALAGCMLTPLAACSNTNDNSAEINELKQQIQELQSEIDSLKNNDNDLFTGSPKFNYNINETIPYFINGNKIFDFKVTKFLFNDNATVVNYSITFAPEFDENLKQSINIRLYDTVSKTVYIYNSHSDGEIIFTSVHSGAETIINLLFHDITFATITATPTRVSNYA